MTQREQTILIIKGAISELPDTERAQCETLIACVREMLADRDNAVGRLAVALLATEMSQ